jgi:hypothetical protein
MFSIIFIIARIYTLVFLDPFRKGKIPGIRPDSELPGTVHYTKLEHGECQAVILAPIDQIW